MKKLLELFNKKGFTVCKAQKSELGYKTDRFELETAKEAMNWLKQSPSNSVKFVHDLWSDEPLFNELKISDL